MELTDTSRSHLGPTDRWLDSTQGENSRRLIDMLQSVGDWPHTRRGAG